MKFPLLIFLFGVIASCIAVTMTLLSSPAYGTLFIIIVGLGVAAIASTVYLFGVSHIWFFLGLPAGILGLYAIADVLLRYFAGMRLLDLLK
jgi:hypothetical protein